MESHFTDEFITCAACNLKFERSSEYRHCSNCFACTGCEIYYCPACDHEIVIKLRKAAGKKNESSGYEHP